MICQLCLVKTAARHHIQRSPSGRLAEGYYCQKCYEAMHLNPSSDEGALVRPRFTIRAMMVVVSVWALPNAVAAWIIRRGYVTGTPAELRLWTVYAFLGVNLLLAIYVTGFFYVAWLRKVAWFKRTGGLVAPPPPASVRQQPAALVLMSQFFAWCVSVIVVVKWLKLTTWPTIQRFSPERSVLLLLLIMLVPQLLVVALVLSRNRILRNRVQQRLTNHIHQEWRLASGSERALKAAVIVWSLALPLLFMVVGPSLGSLRLVLVPNSCRNSSLGSCRGWSHDWVGAVDASSLDRERALGVNCAEPGS